MYIKEKTEFPIIIVLGREREWNKFTLRKWELNTTGGKRYRELVIIGFLLYLIVVINSVIDMHTKCELSYSRIETVIKILCYLL